METLPTWTYAVITALAAAGGLAAWMWFTRPRRERQRMQAADDRTAEAFAERAARQRERAAAIEKARQEWLS